MTTWQFLLGLGFFAVYGAALLYSRRWMRNNDEDRLP